MKCKDNTILSKNKNLKMIFFFFFLLILDHGVIMDDTGIHHSIMPIHYDIIEDGQNKKKILSFDSLIPEECSY